MDLESNEMNVLCLYTEDWLHLENNQLQIIIAHLCMDNVVFWWFTLFINVTLYIIMSF